MRANKTLAVASAVAAISLTIAVIALNRSARPTTVVPSPQQPRTHLNKSTATHTASQQIELINQHKISASTLQTETGRAFSLARNEPMRPPGNAMSYVEGMLPASRSGNAVASYEIFLAILDCGNSLRYEGQEYEPVNSRKDPSLSGNEHDEARQNLADCENLLTNPSFQSADWLTLAAKQGSVEAMLMYSVNPEHVLGPRQDDALQPALAEKWKLDSISYLEQAASLGNVEALYRLSDAYSNDVLAEPDPVEAYAYRSALSKSTGRPLEEWEIRKFQGPLSPAQIPQAQARSNQIVMNCCID